MTRDYGFFLKDILGAIEDIDRFVGEMSIDEFVADEKTKSAVVWKIATIGEAAKNIPQTLRLQHKGIPWRSMAKMRDKIAHRYFGIDFDLVWGVVKKELPPIRTELAILLRQIEQTRD